MNKLVVFVAFASLCYAQSPNGLEEPITILKFENDGPNPDGSYKYSYETANGISAEEEGQLKDAGTENEAAEVRGSYKYTAPDGTLVSVTYIANENGFQPQGTHISVAGLQQRTVQASAKTESTAAVALTTQSQPQSSSEQPQTTAAAAAQEEASGNGNNGNGEMANEAEASLFRPVYRARSGRGRF